MIRPYLQDIHIQISSKTGCTAVWKLRDFTEKGYWTRCCSICPECRNLTGPFSKVFPANFRQQKLAQLLSKQAMKVFLKCFQFLFKYRMHSKTKCLFLVLFWFLFLLVYKKIELLMWKKICLIFHLIAL